MFDEAQNVEIERLVSLEELLSTLKMFKKYKSLGLDGRPLEFYLEFFNFMGGDILKVLNEIKDNRVV